ncbi:MAG: EF-P lysine aminoacylase GenX, partial [Pirellulales bacterium]|nr:EF-P lysine aminoacylase GenX [Pirellulales bacterium]
MKPSIKMLAERASLLGELRQFFDARGFLETQPPCLGRDCVVDAYLDPLRIDSDQFQLGEPDLPSTYYLQTSPESAMKRMLAAGAPS